MSNIFLVEDDENWAAAFKDLLSFKGHSVEHKLNGMLALDFLIDKQADIGLILTDYNMPYINGYDFSKAIKTEPDYLRFSGIHIIGIGDFPENKREYLTKYTSKLGMDLKEMLAWIDAYSR